MLVLLVVDKWAKELFVEKTLLSIPTTSITGQLLFK